VLGAVLLQLGEQQKPISVNVQLEHYGGKRVFFFTWESRI